VQLSPFGRITDEFLRFVERHPDRGTPYAPLALLVGEGHGFHHDGHDTGAFGLPAARSPAVLAHGRHDASIRDWLRIAFHPLGRVEGEPASSPRQSFAGSRFGDVLDVLAAGRADPVAAAARALEGYRVVLVAGEVPLGPGWGEALEGFVRRGGTLVASEGQLSGPGAARLGLGTSAAPGAAPRQPARRLRLLLEGARPVELDTNAYRHSQRLGPGRVLATSGAGVPVAVERTRGRGRIVHVGIPLGLGIDGRASPLLARLLVHLRRGLLPVEVEGPVGYALNRNRHGWVLTLRDDRGPRKPPHGLALRDGRAPARVRLSTRLPVRSAREWVEERALPVGARGAERQVELAVPPGGLRIVELRLR
jgi:hypothetical protein